MHFRVARPMFNRVFRVQRNDLVETWNSSWFVQKIIWCWMIWKGMVWVVYENEIQASCLLVSVFFIRIVATLHIAFSCHPFLISPASVFTLFRCGVDYTWRRTWRRLWSTNVSIVTKLSPSTFYPFTLKVGSTSSSVKPSTVMYGKQ